jgi:probable F420-dependent oxidoreductase
LRVGVHVPQWGPEATRAGVLEIARSAEAAGLDSVWVADHIVLPPRTRSRYPYSRDGTTVFKPEDGFLDALTTLAVIAGATERIRVGTSVLVLPMRQPLPVAKAVATLDVLSGGRLVLALGTGWLREEFDALGVPFETRGERLAEMVTALRRLWADGRAAAEGEHIRFEEVVCEPRPVRPGGPPLWIGGTSEAALRRAAEYGDGWHAVGSRPGLLAEGRRRLAELALAAGREPGALNFSTSAGLPADPGRALERLTALQAAGLDDLVLNLPGETVHDMLLHIDRLATDLLPALVAAEPRC